MVNQYGVNLNAAGLRFGTGVFTPRVLGVNSAGTTLSAGRDIYERLRVDARLFHLRWGSGPSSTILTATLREVISPRRNLIQFITYTWGRTSVAFGGNLFSNRLTLGVEYQTLYVPFRTGNPFRQALVLNIRLQLFDNFRVNAGTFVAPEGSVKYTVYASEFLYRTQGLTAGAAPSAVRIARYIVRCRVVDEQGNPIARALRIDGELALTNSHGEFFVRKSKRKKYGLVVLLKEFLVPGRFEMVSGPGEVTAEPEETASEVLITLKRAGTAFDSMLRSPAQTLPPE